jgi:putative phosphoesterase
VEDGVVTDVLLIADTHLAPGRAGRLLERIRPQLAAADVVLHAGDITDESVLDALREVVGPGAVHAVLGNNDVGMRLPERIVVDVAGCSIAVVHDSGAATGRARRLRAWFPDADLVVFGHSHLPWHAVDVRAADGHVQHHVNPGSAMQRRRAPACTVAEVVVRDGAVVDVRHVPVG